MSARGAVKIPVVGIGMATYLMAYQLAGKYACISESKNWTPAFIKAVKEAGCYERMTSMRTLPKALRFPVPEDYYTQEEFEEEVIKIAKRQVEEEGAQLLVIIFGLLSLLMPPGWKERLETELGVIVLDPMAIAVKTTEMLVDLGLAHSKIEYPQMEV
jgi:allantoin racemase